MHFCSVEHEKPFRASLFIWDKYLFFFFFLVYKGMQQQQLHPAVSTPAQKERKNYNGTGHTHARIRGDRATVYHRRASEMRCVISARPGSSSRNRLDAEFAHRYITRVFLSRITEEIETSLTSSRYGSAVSPPLVLDGRHLSSLSRVERHHGTKTVRSTVKRRRTNRERNM